MPDRADIIIAGTVLAASVDLILTRDGFKTLRVSSGEQALAHVRALRPRLVVLETGLQEMSGLEVCQRLRDDPDFSDIRIAMIVQDSRAVYRRKVLALGADDIVVAPVLAKDLDALVSEFMDGDVDES